MNRIYHTWDKWECYPAGFYENKPKNKSLTDDDCKKKYAEFLSDIPMFEAAMQSILLEWKNSCEHYLSNEKMNRIAWLGQASMCYATGIPSKFCGGFYLLSDEQQNLANICALKFLNKWLKKRGEDELSLDQAQSKTEANLY
jgi:hypothetical protein